VAGPATAMALQQVGIEAVVLEARDRAATEAGSYLTIAPNGLDALAAIGCLDLVRGLGFPSRRNTMLGATGRRPDPTPGRRLRLRPWATAAGCCPALRRPGLRISVGFMAAASWLC